MPKDRTLGEVVADAAQDQIVPTIRVASFGAEKLGLDPKKILAEIAAASPEFPSVAALALAALMQQARHFKKQLPNRSKGAPKGRGDAYDALVFELVRTAQVQAAQAGRPALTIAAALTAVRPGLARRNGLLPGVTVKALRGRYERGQKAVLNKSSNAAK